MLLRRVFLGNIKRNEVLSRNLSTTLIKRKKDESTPDNVVKSKETKKSGKEEVETKLNKLLESMSKETQKDFPLVSKLSLASPTPRPKAIKKKSKNSKVDPDMILAVENVSNVFTKEKEEVKKKLIAKLEAVADESETNQTLPPKPDKARAKELTNLLSTLKVDASKVKRDPHPNLSDVKVENVYSGKPSGVFQNCQFKEVPNVPKLNIWNKLKERELNLAFTHPPANGFEQLILWTKQGKLWQFPINNEQGLEEEAQVGFHEHIFLDSHLEPWCPRRGPIRHFMELVTVGLSKNPFLTVAQKKAHINWFREFFEGQRKVLTEVGALPDTATKSPPSIST